MSNVYLQQKRGILVYRLRHACAWAFEAKSKKAARKIIDNAAQEVWEEAAYVVSRGECTTAEIAEWEVFFRNEWNAARKAYLPNNRKGRVMGKSYFERTGKLGPKINIFAKSQDGTLFYICSTNWHKRCKDAVASVAEARGFSPEDLRGYFSEPAGVTRTSLQG